MSNREIIVAHYEAGKVGDLAGMLAPLAGDVAWTEAAGFPCAGTYIGPAAVALGGREDGDGDTPCVRLSA